MMALDAYTRISDDVGTLLDPDASVEESGDERTPAATETKQERDDERE